MINLNTNPQNYFQPIQEPPLAAGPIQNLPINGQIFVNGPSPNDVKQGQIGDCFFLASLASVADSNPQFIKDSIKQNEDGTFTVRFFDQKGHPSYVTVANKFAQDSDGLILASSTNKKEMWVAIMEKAYAKWEHGIKNIDGGYPAQALTDITGHSKNDDIFNRSERANTLFKKIKEAADQNQPMAAGTYPDNPHYEEMGLVPSHAYTILGAKEEAGKKYILLRNPWGEGEWQGRGADTRNDGVFKMPAEDYEKYFQVTTISQTPLKAAPPVSSIHFVFIGV